MKKLIKLFIILIILSAGLSSCFPLYPGRYGDQGYIGQGYRGQGYRDYGYRGQEYRNQGYRDNGYRGQGYRGQGDRNNRHHDRYSDRGDWNYNSRHE